ncbi:hypothetical protein IJM16_02150 [Candidatus Saccharibacteria bacterium]|nr:hypothetical protein [Candidatus Saccharibacteria bacterium]
MNMLKKLLAIFGLAAITTIIVAAPSFASIVQCVEEYYTNISTEQDDTHRVKCPTVKDEDGNYISLYGITSADCASIAPLAADPESCGGMKEVEKTGKEEEEETEFLNSGETLAYFGKCVGEYSKYPELSLYKSFDYPITCPVMQYDKDSEALVQFYAKTPSDCQSAEYAAVDTDNCGRPGNVVASTAKYDDDNDPYFTIVAIIAIAFFIFSFIFVVVFWIRIVKRVKGIGSSVVNGAPKPLSDDGQTYTLYPDSNPTPGQTPNQPTQPQNQDQNQPPYPSIKI